MGTRHPVERVDTRGRVQKSSERVVSSGYQSNEVSIGRMKMVEKLRVEIKKLDKTIRKYDGRFDITSVVKRREKNKNN